MIEKQKTIKNTITISGVGLHTGKNVNMTFKPAPENHGYKFKRIDLPDTPTIKADVDYVIDTSRGTTLEQNNVRITTVEHALAAVAGLGIDNILIELDGTEVPIMDGSSKVFVEALLKAGIKEQEEEKVYYEIKDNIHFEDKENKIDMFVLPYDDFKVTVMIDYNSPVLGRQHATLHKIDHFVEEFSSARTFVFLHELEYLLKNDRIKGGDLSNAIVVVDRMIADEEVDHLAGIFKKPKVEIKKEGILNAELIHQNEPARHKLLDLAGDLALIGMPLKGRIIATRPGHSANVQFAKLIKQQITKDKARKKDLAPKVDFNAAPLYDINKIKKILPHRPPFLLIDKVIEMGENYVIGMKNVTMNEAFFVGHFPDEPIMPGVLQVEAMAQTGGIFVLNTVPDPENYLTFFLKIDNVKFRHNVVPGDTLIFKLINKSPIRRGICEMKGTAFVGDKIVMEAELMAQIVKKTR